MTDTPAPKQTMYAASYLGGTAKTWYINTFGTVTPLPGLDAFLTEFKAFFTSPSASDDAFTQVEHIEQGKRTGNEYVTEFKLLLGQLRSATDSHWSKHYFLRELTRKVREAVINDIADDDDINKIIAKALKKEAVQKYASALNPVLSPATNRNEMSYYRKHSSHPVYIVASSSRQDAPAAGKLGKFTSEERKLLDENNGCYGCQKINAGHWSKGLPRVQA